MLVVEDAGGFLLVHVLIDADCAPRLRGPRLGCAAVAHSHRKAALVHV